jgi:hypothetical protein
LAVLLILAEQASAQKPYAFVVDASKPYVYLAFDHVGRREAAREGESPQGLWLRLINNCRVPIEVVTHDLGTGDPGVGIKYYVVAVGGIVDDPTPDARPRGYSLHVGFSVVIQPGASLLFSVPRDHVSKWWYLQTRLEFALPSPGPGFGSHPFGTASFSWEEIPAKYRQVSP